MKQYDGVICKEKSLAIKFIAVMLMIILHLFAFPKRIENVQYISIMKIGTSTIEYYFSIVGSICVQMFLFLSGYGLYIQSVKSNISYKKTFNRVIKFYINYWVVFLIFIPMGMILGVYKFNLNQFVRNLMAIESSYNAEWWFVRLYIMLIILYPILFNFINKFNIKIILVISFLLNLIGYGFPIIMPIINLDNSFTELIGLILGGQFSFMSGIIVCKYSIFEKLCNRLKFTRKKYILIAVIIFLIIWIMQLIPLMGEVSNLFFVPIFIFLLANSFKEKSLISLVGEHSTNIWLTHSFFCYYIFQTLTFAPRYSLLIILWILIMNIFISVFIKFILNGIQNGISIFKYKKSYLNHN